MNHRTMRIAIVACFSLSACAGVLPQPVQPPATTDPEAIDRYLEQQLLRRELVGLSVVVMRDGKITLRKGYGKRSLESGAPVQPDTMFAVGSITKQFTAACTLLLAEDGKLSVNDTVAKYFPDLSGASQITLLDLMSHTSGYPDYYPLDFVDGRMRRSIEGSQLLRQYAGGKLDFTPGTRQSYSNTGYVLLALILEKVSGEPFGRFLERRILQPLGMHHTRYQPTIDGDNFAHSYFSFALANKERATDEAKGWLGGAGALYSTASDLATWDLALMTGRVLKPESYRLMTTPRTLANGAPTRYGCGLAIVNSHGELVLQHSGAVAGFAASNAMVPATRSAVIVLSNVSQYDAMTETAEALLAAITPRHDVPAVNGPDAVEVARELFRQLRTGKVDRSRFGAAFNEFLTEARIHSAAAALASYGEPRSVTLESRSERGGMERTTVRLTFKAGSLKADMFRTHDGLVLQFLLEKPGHL